MRYSRTPFVAECDTRSAERQPATGRPAVPDPDHDDDDDHINRQQARPWSVAYQTLNAVLSGQV
eukprot:336667-Chlamydomonas_euryale.AAC.6